MKHISRAVDPDDPFGYEDEPVFDFGEDPAFDQPCSCYFKSSKNLNCFKSFLYR